MNIYITLDYELFFAQESGSVEKSIIEPTQKLLDVVEHLGIKLCFFVDSGYLVNLKKYKDEYPLLQHDYNLITQQIRQLHQKGHDIQLHIHPHWEDTIYDGQKWVMDTTRYRLHHFSKEMVDEIVFKYKEALTELVGDTIFAYRAGGWCIQPFSQIKDALKKNRIWLDSTLYKDGQKDNTTHYMDFRNMPNHTEWRFEDDPLVEDKDGYFIELPISSTKVSPLFYIQYALLRKFNKKAHAIHGDGKGVGREGKDTLKMLLKSEQAVASIDGFRISYLQKALNNYAKKEDNRHFVAMGHPKALTPYSLKAFKKFVTTNHTKHNFTTYSKEFTSN
jgi:hypothetical protein